MRFNKRLTTVLVLILSVVALASMTSIQQQQPQQQQGPPQQRPEPKLVNIKVLKKMTYRQVDHLMDEWASALGVRCNFCHANNPTTNRVDYTLDTKPEKKMARDMYQMAAKINSKYFKAKKDTLGAVMESSVNCYSCHHGVSHPEISLVENRPRPPRNGQGGQGAPGGQPGQPGQNGQGGQGGQPGQRGPGGQGGQGQTTTPPPPPHTK